eukprot:NODE_349_length_8994_cov_1.235526.p4 type:complete len:252 gc:universal NODE_349_length_8994_cov_1.235526:4487-5242(+)
MIPKSTSINLKQPLMSDQNFDKLEKEMGEDFLKDQDEVEKTSKEIIDEKDVPESVKKGENQQVEESKDGNAESQVEQDQNKKSDQEENNKGAADAENQDGNQKIGVDDDSKSQLAENNNLKVNEADPKNSGEDLSLDDPVESPNDGSPEDNSGDPKDADDGQPENPNDGLVLDDPVIESLENKENSNDKVPIQVDSAPQRGYPPMLAPSPFTDSVSYAPIACAALVTLVLLYFIFKPKQKYSRVSQNNKSI